MDLQEVRTIGQCIDLAITDANGDEEVASSWENCLDEVFADVDAELAGQPVTLLGFCGISGAVLAVCRWKKKKLRVTMDSLQFKNLDKVQNLWLRAS